MSSPTIQLPVVQVSAVPATASTAARARLVKRARALSLLTIGWMTIEAAVALIAAVIAGSIALFAFGLDSLIELCSATTILWLYTRPTGQTEHAERRAQQLVAACFLALALYITADAIDSLVTGARPAPSWPGIIVSIGAVVFMPLLARAKTRLARQLNSIATAGDAAQSRLCALTAAAVLISLLANQTLGWWRLDPLAGLLIAGLAIHESRQTWHGHACSDCAPIAPSHSSAAACDNRCCD